MIRNDASADAARAHYDRWAQAYGRSRLLPSLQKKALGELAPEPSDHLLDVACGAGKVVVETAPLVERAVGVDLSDGMLALARARLDAAREVEPLENVEFHRAPSDALPFEDASFTALLCTTAFHHFPDPQGSIDEMGRVLATNGRLVIGDATKDSPVTKIADPLYKRFEEGHVGLQRRRDIEVMLGRAGLEVTRSRRVWLGIYAIVSAKRPAARHGSA